MAAIDFPNSPTDGELFTVGDITWEWDATAVLWRSLTLAKPKEPPTNADAATSAGYIGLPIVAATTGALTLSKTHSGTQIYTTADRTVTIPANASAPLEIGTTFVFTSGAGATTTIAITSDTLILAGDGGTGSKTLDPHGMATAVKVAATTWVISGNGLT